MGILSDIKDKVVGFSKAHPVLAGVGVAAGVVATGGIGGIVAGAGAAVAGITGFVAANAGALATGAVAGGVVGLAAKKAKDSDEKKE